MLAMCFANALQLIKAIDACIPCRPLEEKFKLFSACEIRLPGYAELNVAVISCDASNACGATEGRNPIRNALASKWTDRVAFVVVALATVLSTASAAPGRKRELHSALHTRRRVRYVCR